MKKIKVSIELDFEVPDNVKLLKIDDDKSLHGIRVNGQNYCFDWIVEKVIKEGPNEFCFPNADDDIANYFYKALCNERLKVRVGSEQHEEGSTRANKKSRSGLRLRK